MTGEWYHCVVTEEEAASHGIESIPNNIGVTHETGEAMPLRKVNFGFRAVDYCLPERDGKLIEVLSI